MNVRNIFKAVVLVIMIAGCRNRPSPSGQIGDDFSASGDMDEVKEIYYRFPSPDEMLNFIDKEELNFTDDFLLPVENSTDFLDSRSQALNLGVYTADMAYITLFQRQKEALTYFRVIYGLSEQLRIAAAFDHNLLKRFEDNLKIPDSLKFIADEAMTDIVDYLVKNDKEKVFAIISIGGFIEGLYIAFNIAGEYSAENPIVQRISDQKLVLDNLLGYCQDYKSDQNVKESIQLLEPIRGIYSQMIVTSEETSVTKTEDGSLIIDGGDKITISENQFVHLRETLFTARRSITENSEN